jgi:hypothetical protein
MLVGLRDRRIPPTLLLALLAVGSLRAGAAEFGAERRLGPLAALIASVWLSAVGLAWLADHYGVF